MRETRRVPPGQRFAGRDPIRVVIADDDRMFARMLRARLSTLEDIDVVGIANDGREAVSMVESFQPDIVLMDVHMPVMDGIEAARRIDELPADVAVVLVTGEDETSDARAYEAGAKAYFRKSDDLMSIVDFVVMMSRLGRVNG